MNEELGIEETDAADVVTGIIEEADVVRANTIDGDERVLVTFAVRVAVTPPLPFRVPVEQVGLLMRTLGVSTLSKVIRMPCLVTLNKDRQVVGVQHIFAKNDEVLRGK